MDEWHVPWPMDEAFVERVRALVAEADWAAREIAPRPRPRVEKPAGESAEDLLDRILAETRVPTGRRCRGCGCPIDKYTRGCSTCTGRRSYRRQAAKRRVEVEWLPRPVNVPAPAAQCYRARSCRGCAGSLDEFTRGCATCSSRHAQRRRALRLRLPKATVGS